MFKSFRTFESYLMAHFILIFSLIVCAFAVLSLLFLPSGTSFGPRLSQAVTIGILCVTFLVLSIWVSSILSRRLSAPLKDMAALVLSTSRGIRKADVESLGGGFAEFRELSENFGALMKKLREAEGKGCYKEFFDGVSDAVCISDRDGNILDANQVSFNMLGYSLSEFISLKFWDVCQPEDHPRLMREISENGESVYKSMRKARDGSLIPVEVKARMIRYQGRECILTLARDIAEWERAMRSIRTSEEKYRTLFNTVSTAMAIVEENRYISLVNDEFCRLSGFDRFAIEGFMNLSHFIPKNHLERITELNRQKEGHGKFVSGSKYEVEFLRPDGEARQVEIRVSQMPGGNQTLIVFIDLSERKRLEAQVVQSEKLAAVGQLISGVAHELNNPLTSVIGYSQLVQMGNVSPALKEYLEIIRNESQRASAIVKGLLIFAREHKPEKRMVQINEVLERTVNLRSYDFKVRNIEVILDLDPNIPETLGDFFQLQQVVLNIINNSEYAMRNNRGHKVLEVNSRLIMEGRVIEIRISDNGSGIEKEILHRIFDPFVTTKEVGKGTGLGLSVSYGIVQEHQGEILVESEVGEGTTFIIHLPILVGEKGKDAVEETDEVASSSVESHGGKTILVVDDEPYPLELIKQILTREGYKVLVTNDAIEGFEILKTCKVDSIISDIRMPGLDGKAFLNRVESQFPHLLKRFIFITGDTVSQEIYGFLQSKGVPCLFKPFEIDELKDILHRVLQQHPVPAIAISSDFHRKRSMQNRHLKNGDSVGYAH